MQLINVNEVLSAFSLALDIAENKTFEHAQRTAYIALRIAKEMDLDKDVVKDIYSAALLHDIGLVNALADVHDNQDLLVSHCKAGRDIVKSLPLSPAVCDYICWHHANWDGKGPFDASGNDISLGAQIIYIADQLDLKMKSLSNLDLQRGEVLDYVKESAGKRFSPDVAQAFLSTQEKELFWLDYNHYHLAEVLTHMQPENETRIDLAGLESIAHTFAKIIDNKSPFTHDHSHGVAHLLSSFNEPYKFDQETARMLKISGLLHDLGKLAVPNSILDKPGKLTPEEFQVIKCHPYYTKLILSKVKAFSQVKEWAANHHESLDGKGYPEGLRGDQLSRQEKMVAICDIYQALTEERPYRSPLAQSKVFEIIEDLVSKGKLCPEIYTDFKKLVK